MVEEKPFRVLLDLSELNLNLSKYIWVNVSPRELNNIADFKNSVLKKINFDRKDIKLYVHDGLLLEDEKIIILRENDTVKVQCDDPGQGVNNNSSRCESDLSGCSQPERITDNANEEFIEKVSSNKRKRKSDLVINGSKNEYESINRSHKKKKKHKHSHSVATIEESVNEVPFNEEIIPVTLLDETEITNVPIQSPEEMQVKTKNRSVNEIETVSVQNNTIAEGKNCKKKRKRHRKRKEIPQIMNTFSIDNVTSAFSEVPVKNIQSSAFSDNFSSVRKHIRFTSPMPSIHETCDDESMSITTDLDTYINKLKVKNSVQALSNVMATPQCPLSQTYVADNSSTPTSLNLETNESWNISPMQNEYTTATKQLRISHNESDLKKIMKVSYEDYPVLNCLPTIGTRVAYKVLELDESYSPSVSKYKEGIVKKIDPVSEEMEIELIQEEIKPGRIGKFENLSKDEIPSPEVIKNVTVSWSALIEPRCITP